MKPVVKPKRTSGRHDAGGRDAETPRQWLSGLSDPELWEVVDEALLRTAFEFPIMGRLAERWVSLPKRVRSRVHVHLAEALRRRMPPP